MMKLMITGTVGKDAEIRSYGTKHLISFSLIHRSDYKNGKGEKEERDNWIKAVIWKREGQSTKVAEFIRKGKRLLIEGDLSVDAFLGKENEPRASLSVNVKNLEFMN